MGCGTRNCAALLISVRVPRVILVRPRASCEPARSHNLGTRQSNCSNGHPWAAIPDSKAHIDALHLHSPQSSSVNLSGQSRRRAAKFPLTPSAEATSSGILHHVTTQPDGELLLPGDFFSRRKNTRVADLCYVPSDWPKWACYQQGVITACFPKSRLYCLAVKSNWRLDERFGLWHYNIYFTHGVLRIDGKYQEVKSESLLAEVGNGVMDLRYSRTITIYWISFCLLSMEEWKRYQWKHCTLWSHVKIMLDVHQIHVCRIQSR